MEIQNKQLIRNIALYMRLSKDDGDEEESESIKNQREIIYEYIKKNFVYDNCYEYVDDGYSGATFLRPGFQKMLSELKKKEIDLIITKNLARFGRNYIESGEFIEKQFPNDNIRYIAILDNVDNFDDRVANDFLPINGVFNELFCKETSKAVKRTKRKKMKEGFYACNVAPFGYKKDENEEGKLIIDEDAAKIVREIFELKLQEYTCKQIADILNKKKYKTPSEYLKIRGMENRTKGIWTSSNVTSLLKKEVYLGHCVRGKTQNISYKSKKRINIKRSEQIKTENTHEPIISEEIYKKVHDNKRYGSIREKEGKIEAKFAEFMYCGICGKKVGKRRSRNFINVYCLDKYQAEILCKNKILYNYNKLENIIIEEIKKNVMQYLKKNNVNIKLINQYNQIQINANYEQIEELEKELKKVNLKISKIYNDRLSGEILEEMYKENYTKLIQCRKDISKNIDDIQQKIKSINNLQEMNKKVKKIKSILKNINKNNFTKEDIEELIEKIELEGKSIHISFKFKEDNSEKISC